MNLKWEDFAPKFGSWTNIIKPIFDKGIFEPIYERLRKDRRRGKVILPASTDTFKAFELCDKENTKVVFIGMEPYPWIKDNKPVADGLCFSCGNHKEAQPSLKFIYKAVGEDFPTEFPFIPDLDYWADQGVLLLNSSLTTLQNQVGYYNNNELRLWEPFFKQFLESFSYTTTGIVYVLFGKQAELYEGYINPLGNYIYKVEHPASAKWGEREWDHKHIFKTIQNILIANNGKGIDWGFIDYLPF